MSLAQVTQLVTLTQINCGECGGTYAINERYRAQRAQDGGGWNCPYCKCSWGYFNNNENATLKAKLAQAERNLTFARNNAQSEREAREATERRLTAQKAAKTRLRNRIKNGVCPCCTRSFSNLHRHMATMHPDFQPEHD